MVGMTMGCELNYPVPPWLEKLVNNPGGVTDSVNRRASVSSKLLNRIPSPMRNAAVLALFGGSFAGVGAELPPDIDVLLTQRSAEMRTHAGQVAFPGGAFDEGDDFPIGTALREAEEETGIDPLGVHPLAILDSFPVPVSGFNVRPVISYWANSSAAQSVSNETSKVVRVPLAELLAPHNRFQVKRSLAGVGVYQGPAFNFEGMLIWGFTGGLLSAIIETAGWEIPWDKNNVRDLLKEQRRAGQ